jgi:hypothetical protein
MSNQVLKALTRLVASLQKSLHKVRQKTNANTEELDTLRGSCSVAYLQHNREIAEAKKATEDFRVQAFQRSEQIAASLALVKKENDDREMRQIVRDQNNVQALHNLKESVQKAFDQVKTDVQSLTKVDLRLKELIKEAFVPTGGLPAGHEWVNKKLTGVYSQFDEVETRLAQAEKLLAVYEKLRKAQAEFAKANGEFVNA